MFAIVLAKKPNQTELLLTQLAANCMRVDLKPMEKALAYKRLIDSNNWNNVQLAKELNIDKSKVTQVLSILRLPQKAIDLLDSGAIGESTAYTIARAPDAETASKMIEMAELGELKRDDAIILVKKRPKQAGPSCRLAFEFPGLAIQVSANQASISFSEIVESSKRLIKECQKAAKENIDPKTLEGLSKPLCLINVAKRF